MSKDTDILLAKLKIYEMFKQEIISLQTTTLTYSGIMIVSVFSSLMVVIFKSVNATAVLKSIPIEIFIFGQFLWFAFIISMTSIIVKSTLSTIRLGFQNYTIEKSLNLPELQYEHTMFANTDRLNRISRTILKITFPSLIIKGYYHKALYLPIVGIFLSALICYMGTALSLYLRCEMTIWFLYSLPILIIIVILEIVMWRHHPLL